MEKIMQGISVLIVLFAVLTVPVVADSPPPIICQATLASAASTMVSIEDTSAPQGGTVTVPIKIVDVENMCGASIWLNYNKDVVIVDSISDGDLVPLTHNIDNIAGVTKMTWDTTSGMTGDFVFAYVTLKAVGNQGDTCLLDLDVKELYDCDLVEIPRTVDDGTFTIPSPCFIATAAYGTPLHKDIDVLRDSRDEYLLSNPPGRAFVKTYYSLSPPIADVIRANEGLKALVREGLVKPLVDITGMVVV